MALEITYWTGAEEGVPESEINSETLSISGTSAQSGATPSNAVYVLVTATEAARLVYGTNPTAAAGNQYIAAHAERWFKAKAGHKIAGITA